ncbi:DNA segregation ATPase FtsK/SpoIIIE, S-DNA-T family [Nitrosomonas sp. Nm51]|uniref:DNA translocase FtsK n=1 Tax=Nitrosomonas sp. Nm51 TaxID=133720 RepID=UPI0008BD5CB3|nr:DNA translocase FtsK [Nitrosomonas sp. Nm51]SER37492.1 DNA segregation ATPase FtsK/SpoIIIE, S-DNA-T family [Nitrosomonas sp. Nm51]
MSLINKSMASKSSGRTLPPRVSRLLRESGWLALVGGALYLILIFYSYDRGDPGWTHSGDYDHINNAGGHIGAWLSDFLLYMFGASAWWWVAFCLAAVSWSYRRIDIAGIFDRHSIFLSIGGFLLLLIASSGLESLRFHTLNIELPYQSGGISGKAVSLCLSQLLGFTGATMTLLILIAIGFSQFTGLSWVRFVEKIGETIENSIFLLQKQWHNRRHQQPRWINDEYEHVKIPATEKKPVLDARSIHIESPAANIEKSERAVKEKQKSLFPSLPESSLPPLHLLDEPDKNVEVLSKNVLESTSRLIESKLKEFGVIVKVVAAYPGPVITRYEIEPAVGVKGNQIINLIKDLARALSVVRIRVVETIPGKTTMGLEIPNPNRQVVRLLEILSSQSYANTTSPLTIALGKDISGRPVVSDLAKMPHALVAGTTGSGKSVAINAIILSLVYKSTPEQVRLILVDPKMLELSVYEGIPHLLTPVVTDMGEAANALRWSVAEMERRYKLMSSLGVRNLNGYNHKIREAEKKEEPIMNPLASEEAPEQLEELPLIVVVIDELADLMMVSGKKVEHLIARLAQKARAAGIHLLLATQRPSVDVITGLIKANIPTRIAFQVSSKIDSRTILDQMGAETLLGQGDMLYLPPGSGYPQRVHGAYVADHEVHKVVEYLKEHGEPCYVEEILQAGEEESAGNTLEETKKQNGGEQDPLYDEAVQIVIKTRRASISLVQRNLRIGYNRAARMIEEMERAGLVSAMQNNGNREVLVPARSE